MAEEIKLIEMGKYEKFPINENFDEMVRVQFPNRDVWVDWKKHFYGDYEQLRELAFRVSISDGDKFIEIIESIFPRRFLDEEIKEYLDKGELSKVKEVLSTFHADDDGEFFHKEDNGLYNIHSWDDYADKLESILVYSEDSNSSNMEKFETWKKDNSGDYQALREFAIELGNTYVYDSIVPKDNIVRDMIDLLKSTNDIDEVFDKFEGIKGEDDLFFHLDDMGYYEPIHDWNEYFDMLKEDYLSK